MRYLLEDPWPLTITFGVVAAFFAWNALRSGNKKVWQIAGVTLAVALLPLVIDKLVETEREKITTSLHSLADAVVAGDVQKALSFVDGGDNIPGSAQQIIENGMEQLDIHEGLRIKGVQIDVNGTEATSDFRANGTVDVKNVANDRHAATRWKLTWKKSGNAWKINKVARLDPLSGEVMGTYSTD